MINSEVYGGNHSICVWGYDDDVEETLIVYDDYGTSVNYITWGGWDYAYMDTLNPY
jgi:hypothetical protein